VWGAVDGGEASELLAALDPSDELGLRGLFAAGAPEGRSASIPGALAVFLARARHTLVRRLGRDVSESRTQRLRRLAARLAAAANPPVGELGSLRSDGRELRGDADAVVWDGTTLAPRAARAALRALAAASDAPLRRWLAAMSRLRVDRELLRMRD
jgi:hypothetical protein